MATKPTTQFTDAAKLPRYLQEHGRFCLWKYEQNKGRWTKVPYQPKAPQYGAASTNPAHFTDLKTAMQARKGFDGVGLGIFGDLAAIDIDHCIDEKGEFSTLAETVIATMDSYTEFSPSGKGIRIIFRVPAGFAYDKDAFYVNNQSACDPRQSWPEKQGLEIYIAGATSKYVTITGNALVPPVEVEERSAEVLEILNRYMRKPAQERTVTAPAPSINNLTDSEIIEIASRAKNGAKFDSLYRAGDIGSYPSHSEADQALFNLLACYTAGDTDRMIRIFETSALYREKEKPKSYYRRTAEKAARDCTTYYTPQQDRAPAVSSTAAPNTEKPKEEKVSMTTAQAVDAFLSKAQTRIYEPIKTGYSSIDTILGGGLIRQTLILLGAAPGAGKTIFAQQVCETIAKNNAGNVLYFNLEMPIEQLLARSLSRKTELTSLQILQGYKWLKPIEEDIRRAAEEYKKEIAPRIKYNPCGGLEYEQILESMEAEAKALEEKGDTLPLVIVVDYLQLLKSRQKIDPVEVIKRATLDFKRFAIERKCVVILIMAQSRNTNENGLATQGAGRDTSSLEYTADLQIALTYKAMLSKKANSKGNLVPEYDSLSSLFAKAGELRDKGLTKEADALIKWRRMTVTKNRFGVENAFCDLYFEGEYSKFIEKAPKGMEEEATKYNYKQRKNVERI